MHNLRGLFASLNCPFVFLSLTPHTPQKITGFLDKCHWHIWYLYCPHSFEIFFKLYAYCILILFKRYHSSCLQTKQWPITPKVGAKWSGGQSPKSKCGRCRWLSIHRPGSPSLVAWAGTLPVTKLWQRLVFHTSQKGHVTSSKCDKRKGTLFSDIVFPPFPCCNLFCS